MTEHPPPALSPALDQAVRVIRQGGVVAFPTETYYGLAVDPFNHQALLRLFSLKKRPQSKPVLVLIHGEAGLSRLACHIPPQFRPLMARFWPGPLTLVFPVQDELPPLLSAGTGTIGVRISSHPLARRFTQEAGGFLTATSANLSGLPPAVNEEQVRVQFGARIDYLLPGGSTLGGQASTVVAARGEGLALLRPGAIAATLLGISPPAPS